MTHRDQKISKVRQMHLVQNQFLTLYRNTVLHINQYMYLPYQQLADMPVQLK
uniref:Uncharacterized protein n=1 Tax=uncultured marine virus TaxID=186617 RepID=A0A0F7L9I3_9VIRU|nr:hypothetical protein [uncultured marine virus]